MRFRTRASLAAPSSRRRGARAVILARPISFDGSGELELALARLGLGGPARDEVLRRVPQVTLLVTGLSRLEGEFLRGGSAARPEEGELPLLVAVDDATRPGAALLLGNREQLERLVRRAGSTLGQQALAKALERALAVGRLPAPLVVGGRAFELGQGPFVMGVLNVTPDSFSDGGRHATPEAAAARAEELIREGADLIDVGGESTRPGAAPVSIEEELGRVVPVIRALRARHPIPISIDTTKAPVAAAALEAGASMVNDISALAFDPRLGSVVAQAKVPLCVMHMRGTPATMQDRPFYFDVVEEVLEQLERAVERAVEAGVARSQVIVDPGIGFGKTTGHNLFLLRRLNDLRVLGQPVLLGTSRKSFLGQVLGGRPPQERVLASAVSVALAALRGGADFVRVHDVAQAREAVAVARAVRTAEEGGQLLESARLPPPRV